MDYKEIQEKIKEDFVKKAKKDTRIQKVLKKIKEGKATYEDASDFAKYAGNHIADILDKYLKENLVDERVTQELAESLLPKSLRLNHQYVADICESVQELLNKKKKIGVKAKRPFYSEHREEGLMNKLVAYEKYKENADTFKQYIENVSMAAVDKSVEVNAEFQYKSGLNPKIQRVAVGHCCKWCQSKVGIWDYGQVKDTGNEVFRRHTNCRCQVLYIPVSYTHLRAHET